MDTKNSPKKLKILASISRRLIAKIIDFVFAVLIFLLIKFIADYMSIYCSWISLKISTLPAVFIALGYLLLSDALPNGQSIGKRLLGISVIDKRSGLGCGLFQSLARNAGAILIIDWIWIFLESRTRLGDMHAKTIVIQAAKLKGQIRSIADIYDGGKF
jgi:uncharacterized RDD family membrane protein YckC